MTAEQFNEWLAAMKADQRYTEPQIRAALGISPNTMLNYKRRGGNRVLRLACELLYRFGIHVDLP